MFKKDDDNDWSIREYWWRDVYEEKTKYGNSEIEKYNLQNEKKNSLVELNSRSELAEEKIDKLEYGSVWSIQSKEQKEKGKKKSKHPQRPVST